MGGNPLSFTDELGLSTGAGAVVGTMGHPKDDNCGCFAKAFIGIDEAALAFGAAATAPILNKPRTGISGGGPSKNKTSIASTLLHEFTNGGRGGAGKVTRKVFRKVGTKFIPYVGAAEFIYDTSEYDKCMAECDRCEL